MFVFCYSCHPLMTMYFLAFSSLLLQVSFLRTYVNEKCYMKYKFIWSQWENKVHRLIAYLHSPRNTQKRDFMIFFSFICTINNQARSGVQILDDTLHTLLKERVFCKPKSCMKLQILDGSQVMK